MIYEPREDSYLLEKQVQKYSKNKKVLDIGSGSGIQALSALRNRAKSVLSSDINPQAVKYLKSINLKAVKSNLFSNIKEKFDLIIFNPPYLPYDLSESKESSLATSGGKNGDEIILRFLLQAKKHLNKSGKILLLISSLTPREAIKKLLKKLKFKSRVLDSNKLFMETLEVWKIEMTLSSSF